MDERGHDWKLVERGPGGHTPPWGDWYECERCGEGTRSAVAPPTDLLVLDGHLTCEEMRAHECCLLNKRRP